MAFEAARFTALRRFEIEAEVVRGLDPRHDARNVVEVHVAARAQAVKNLL
jgi:hypothetical protein